MKSVKILLAAVMLAGTAMPDFALAKAKTNHSAAQRKAAYEQGLKYCRKKYGERLHSVVVEMNYGKWGAWCYTY
jgi:predicted secreted acid phosphatase